jgi:predicted nucleotidyltransferase
MKTAKNARRRDPSTGLYYPHTVPMSAIRRYARQIVEKFDPERVILFGSYAYGTPTPDSDVDLLVVMHARDQFSQAVRIAEAIERGFPLDLLVRTPRVLKQRLQWGDWFLREIVTRGRILYEKADCRVATQSRERPPRRSRAPGHAAPVARRGRVPLSTGKRKIPQSLAARAHTADAEDTRYQGPA